MNEREKDSFYCFARQRTPQQVHVLKTVPYIGKNGWEFYNKKEKKGFQIGIRIEANMHYSFAGRILVIEASVRSWHDHGGDLLGYCLE